MSQIRAAEFGLILMVSVFLGCNSLGKPEPDPLYNLEQDDDRGIFASVTDGVSSRVRGAMGLGPDEQAANQEYQQAMAQYQQATELEGRARKQAFEDAAKAFKTAAARWPNSSIQEDALFFRAESIFFAEQFPKAQTIFSELVAKYPSTRYAEKISQRRFQIAKYWLDHHQESNQLALSPNFVARDRPTFDQFGNAIKLLERIRLDDPTGELADDATMLAATACLDSGKHYRADELLTDLRNSFPSSKHQYQAHVLALKDQNQALSGASVRPRSTGRSGRDRQTDASPVSAGVVRDREFLTAAYKDIRMNRAIREMARARSRDRRQEFRAARMRYQRVAEEFSDTSLAQEAEERLAQLEGRPDLPPQRLQILANAFPSSSDEQPILAADPDRQMR